LNRLNLGLNYKDTLNQTLTRSDPTKGTIKFDWGIFLNVYGFIAGFFAIGGLIARYITALKPVSNPLFVSGVIVFLIQFIAGLFKRVSITITEHRTDSAEGFERRFKDDILKHKRLSKTRKLLVIIDNLDRCSHPKAVELLSTIKTFLARDIDRRNRCVFLIACDDMAIRKHLVSVYGLKTNDADEFLRKFFNTFQRIPDFIDIELQTYTESLLKETGVPQFDSSNVAYVITSAFRENPRQVKQFINTLLTHFLLAQERENGKSPLIVPRGAVTDNAAFLAKFLIIRQQFPNIYSVIIENYLSAADIEKFDFKNSGIDFEDQIIKFREFLGATKGITVDNVRPFHYLKQSKEELSIPEIDQLKLALIDNKEKIVKEQIEKLNPEQVESFEKIVISLIDRNKTKRILLGNIISSCLIGLQHNKKTLSSHFYNRIAGLLNDDRSLGTDLQRFEPSLIFDEVLWRCNPSDKKDIINRYINLLSKAKESEAIE